MAYSDGWSLWRINGVQVDEQIVMRPNTQTIAQIDAETNGDVRSIRLERFGWNRYVKETGSMCIEYRDNAITGAPEALYVTPRGEKVLLGGCQTGKLCAMPLPSEITSCQQAQDWLGPQIPGLKLNCIGAT